MSPDSMEDNMAKVFEAIREVANFAHWDDASVLSETEYGSAGTMSGSIKKKTGRNLLVVTIPFSTGKVFMAHQLELALAEKERLEAEIASIDAYINTLKD